MSTDLQQQNNDFNQDFDQQDDGSNGGGQQQQQQFDGGNEFNENNFNNDNDDDENNDGDDDDDEDQKGNFGVEGPKCVRLRGLPWSATHQEILNFLKNITVINGAKGIHLVTSRWDGKNTGEAFVEVQSQADVDSALKLNREMMGHRYIEVFTANPKEAQAAMKKTGGPGQSFVVKLRGLPYAVTEQQVEEFFNGLEIKADREGILFVMDRRGRATGEAYVQFESQEDTEQALGRNREKIGHRYIEIFRSSLAELKRSSNGNGRPGPYDLKDRGSNRGDFGGGRNNMMRGGGNDWNGGGGNGGGFGVGANNTLGFNNYSNNGNFGNFGNNGGGNGGNFGGNGGGFGGGNNGGGFGGNSRFNNSGGGGNGGNNGNFSSDFGDFGNFGNSRNNNFNSGSNDFTDDSGFGGRGNNGSNFGTGGNFGNMGNFGNFGNGGDGMDGGSNNMGSGGNGNGGFNNSNMGNNGGNFGPIGGGRNDSEYFSIHMRGLPYASYENDVFKFFDPIRPSNVRINFNKKGLHSGTADVFFDTCEDAQLAMKRHKDQMGNRYIELFFDGKIKGGNFRRI